jgi:hypothetical protein
MVRLFATSDPRGHVFNALGRQADACLVCGKTADAKGSCIPDGETKHRRLNVALVRLFRAREA